MDLIKSLVNYLKSNKEVNKEESPEGLCPNCWGRQEYGGNFYEAVKNHGLDVNTKQPEIGWIKDYAEKHLKGIRLETKNDSVACPSCKISYREQ
ncbi:MAG: hypothetical protein ABF293_04690 [Flavobacteriaceae bacterium]